MKIVLFNLFFLLTLEHSFAQKITYSIDEGFPSQHTEFNIIGKIGSRYLVHINNNYTHNQSRFCLYDSAMHLISIQKTGMPDPYFGISFIYYPTMAYMFYQYTHSDHTVFSAIRFDSSGKIFGNPIELTKGDRLRSFSQNPIFNVAYSDDKSKIAIFSVENFEDAHELKLLIFNQKLEKISEKKFIISKFDSYESLEEFKINNAGDFIFLKRSTLGLKGVFKNILNYSRFNSGDLYYYDITPLKAQLNDPTIYADNEKRKIHIFSLYADSLLSVLGSDISLSKAKDKSGLYYVSWDIDSNKVLDAQLIPFSSFIADDPEFMKLSVQSLRVKTFIKKSSGGFILQGWNSEYNTNTFLQDFVQRIQIGQYLNYYDGRPAINLETAEYFNYQIGGSYNTDIEKRNPMRKQSEFDMFFMSFDKSDSLTKFTNLENADNTIMIKTRDGIHYLVFYGKKDEYNANHYLLNSSGIIAKQPPVHNTTDHEIYSYGSI